ncbi:hypothetical protein [Diaphorobacter caeni]|uniref:hypothetical protein n=1 Tax=Diaphorobacter caeni TaxID=2784387 RepID=UPI001E42E5DC|nr:hypothetical protein [Diaphorobacter caeni]
MNIIASTFQRLSIALASAFVALAAHAVDIDMPSGVLKLDMPKGYTELSGAEIDTKFGRNGRKPLKAYGNARRTSTVSVTWSEMKKPLSQGSLPELKEAMENMMPKLTPGLAFNDSRMVKIGARQWVLLDSTVPAIDTELRNVMYLSDMDGHMVGVNFNSTVQEFTSQQKAFETSAQTLKVD